ncbi:D-alanyl-D-alanine carboxypeptidase family protein [Halonatronum saccharophilum]|uniref:D-alanyl-D-alanine carboxypeptidase family protein n=1 Tax=Halonatronum saccharophilum TaxID=150060 RepID=UPI0004861743|nr:D-alanyl-D-alanine carboxypeptidase family protein [Halonatronum saccharophilum]
MNKASKRIILILVVSLLLNIGLNISVFASPSISSYAAILIDGDTGEVLYGKNIHKRRAPASTTKIMTGILAIEQGNLSDEVTASPRAAYEGGSSIYLVPGETLTLREMVYGLMVKSGNDAAVAIAEHIGGSVEDFAQMMNIKAREVGALNTTFKNPNGLPQEGHLTTAYDLAQITRYALQNPFFSEVVATPKKRISWPGNSWDRILKNTNRLLTRSDIVDGVKTGYTRAAGRCLVASATKNGRRLISVVLKSGDMWGESLALLNYGFDNYDRVDLIDKGEVVHQIKLRRGEKIDLIADKDFKVVIPKGEEVNIKRSLRVYNYTLPIRRGDKMGNISFYNNEGQLIGKVDIISDRDVEESAINRFWKIITSRIQIYF